MDINSIKDQYTCLICQNIYSNPIKITKCGHNFCKDCIFNYINLKINNAQEVQCPICRAQFVTTNIVPDDNLINEMNSKSYQCECGTTISLSQYSEHNNTCSSIQNKMNEEMKNKNIQIQPDKVQINRQTFDCTLCSQKNLDRVGYIDHIKKFHPNDRGVCSICKCQPWGDPNYKTHILGHINIRHQFDYDTVVDYNNEEDEILKRVLLESMNDK